MGNRLLVIKKPTVVGSMLDGARGRTRTVMIFLSLDFESSASTDFTTRAVLV